MTSSTFPRFINPSYFSGSACIFLNISTVLFIISFSSPNWFESDDAYYVGLWQACYKMPEDKEDVDPSISTTASEVGEQWQCSTALNWMTNMAKALENDWLVCVEAILVISLIFLIVTSVSLILFVGSSPMQRELAQGILFASFCLTFAIACLCLTAVIICGVNVSQENSAVFRADLSWSFTIAVISTFINWLCAFALLVEVIRVMAAASVDPHLGGSMTSQQSFEAQYRAMELRESFDSRRNVDQNEAAGYENEASAVQDEAGANQSEAGAVQDGGGQYEKPQASWSEEEAVGDHLYASLGIIPSQFNTNYI